MALVKWVAVVAGWEAAAAVAGANAVLLTDNQRRLVPEDCSLAENVGENADSPAFFAVPVTLDMDSEAQK